MRIAALLAAALTLAQPSAAIAQAASAQAPTAPTNRTYEAVIGGMSCRQQTTGRVDCQYSVGESLRILITGVGQEDAVVSFQKVDSTAGYVAGFAALHGCVIVRPARVRPDSLAALAFVSPRDGKVYRLWQHCRQPPKR